MPPADGVHHLPDASSRGTSTTVVPAWSQTRMTGANPPRSWRPSPCTGGTFWAVYVRKGAIHGFSWSTTPPKARGGSRSNMPRGGPAPAQPPQPGGRQWTYSRIPWGRGAREKMGVEARLAQPNNHATLGAAAHKTGRGATRLHPWLSSSQSRAHGAPSRGAAAPAQSSCLAASSASRRRRSSSSSFAWRTASGSASYSS